MNLSLMFGLVNGRQSLSLQKLPLFATQYASIQNHKPVPTFPPSPLAPLLEKIPMMPKLM